MPWFAKIEKGTVEKAIFDKYVSEHIAYVQNLIAKGHKAKRLSQEPTDLAQKISVVKRKTERLCP